MDIKAPLELPSRSQHYQPGQGGGSLPRYSSIRMRNATPPLSFTVVVEGPSMKIVYGLCQQNFPYEKLISADAGPAVRVLTTTGLSAESTK